MTWLGQFGCPTPKPTQFHTTWEHDAVVEFLVKGKPETCDKQSTYKSRTGWTCGQDHLQDTEAYTPELGDAMANAFQKTQQSRFLRGYVT